MEQTKKDKSIRISIPNSLENLSKKEIIEMLLAIVYSQTNVYIAYKPEYENYHNWYTFYHNGKPVTNVIKKILNENNIKVDNNTWSILCNEIRKEYPAEMDIEVILKDPEYFDSFEYNKYNWGDDDSCFRLYKINNHQAKYLKYYLNDYVYLVLFKFFQNNKEIGKGRSWIFCIPNKYETKNIFWFNIYSKGFDMLNNIKRVRLSIVRAFEILFDIPNLRIRESQYELPAIYTNKIKFEILSENIDISEYINNIKVICPSCKKETYFCELHNFDVEEKERAIVCYDCRDNVDDYIKKCDICNNHFNYQDILSFYMTEDFEAWICKYCIKDLKDHFWGV